MWRGQSIAPFYAGYYQPTAESVRGVTAPALVIWGAADAGIPASDREQIIGLLTETDRTFEAVMYPASHAFMDDHHPTHHRESMEDAWPELLGWFSRYLG